MNHSKLNPWCIVLKEGPQNTTKILISFETQESARDFLNKLAESDRKQTPKFLNPDWNQVTNINKDAYMCKFKYEEDCPWFYKWCWVAHRFDVEHKLLPSWFKENFAVTW